MFKAFSKYYRIGCNFDLLTFSERNSRIRNVTNAAAFSTKCDDKTQRKNVLLNVKDEIISKIGKLDIPRKIQSKFEKVKELDIKEIKPKCRRQSNKKQLKGLSITSPPQPTESSKNPTTALSQSNSAPAFNRELNELIEQQSIIHKYTDDQRPRTSKIKKRRRKKNKLNLCFLYFLIRPGTNIILRYGETCNPKRRKKEHMRKKLFDKNFEMILAPLGNQTKNFILNIEGALIQFSRMKLLNDGKQNKNNKDDIGRFSSKELKEIAGNKNHDKRGWLIIALNQLIALTFEKGEKV
uniref:Uncharacterized protein n=1 Tax=Panagrolaimus davidi TaxID=227884 RepID=A0A914PKA0_9BILA